MNVRMPGSLTEIKSSVVSRLGAAPGLPKSSFHVFAKKAFVAVLPRQRVLKATLSSGAVVYGENRAGYGGRSVYIFGDESEPEFEHLDQFLDQTGVFVEVGANTGKHSIKAAKHYGDGGVVIAIEPNPEILATLHRSIQANDFNNVRLRNLCIGDCRTSGRMWMNNRKPVMFSLVKNDDSAESFSTLTLTFDELFAWEGLDRLDFLKICAEGAEGRVLSGARETITKCRPIVQIETDRVDVPIVQPDYRCFQAPAGSMSKFWMPAEHPKVDLPRQLGWAAVN